VSRTKSHRPTKFNEPLRSGNLMAMVRLSQTANLPTHGRAGAYIRSITRVCGTSAFNHAARERRRMLRSLASIRTREDADEASA